MGRISATFKNSIEGMTKAYADANGISFSEAVEALTGVSVTTWFDKLPKKVKSELIEQYNIFPNKNAVKPLS